MLNNEDIQIILNVIANVNIKGGEDLDKIYELKCKLKAMMAKNSDNKE